MNDIKKGGIVIIDFGSQYTKLIARRLNVIGLMNVQVSNISEVGSTSNQHIETSVQQLLAAE